MNGESAVSSTNIKEMEVSCSQSIFFFSSFLFATVDHLLGLCAYSSVNET